MDAYKHALVAGGVLAGVVAVWQLASAASGLTSLFVPVATALQLAVLLGLLYSQRQQASYLQQLGGGVLASAVASVVIGVTALFVLPALLPDAYPALQEETRQAMAGSTPEEIEAAVAMATPGPQALAGVIGTLVTGAFVSAIAAVFLRRKD